MNDTEMHIITADNVGKDLLFIICCLYIHMHTKYPAICGHELEILRYLYHDLFYFVFDYRKDNTTMKKKICFFEKITCLTWRTYICIYAGGNLELDLPMDYFEVLHILYFQSYQQLHPRAEAIWLFVLGSENLKRNESKHISLYAISFVDHIIFLQTQLK